MDIKFRVSGVIGNIKISFVFRSVKCWNLLRNSDCVTCLDSLINRVCSTFWFCGYRWQKCWSQSVFSWALVAIFDWVNFNFMAWINKELEFFFSVIQHTHYTFGVCPCFLVLLFVERVIMWSEHLHPGFVSLKRKLWEPDDKTHKVRVNRKCYSMPFHGRFSFF